VLIALVSGLALGAAAATTGSEHLASTIDTVGVLGTLWINAIRMTVIPLVAALTIGSVATLGDVRQVGRLGATALVVFLALLVAGGVFTMLVTPLSLDHLALSTETIARIRQSADTTAATPAAMPTLAQRVLDMVPANPIRAAADGAILPVVVFALAFGLALARVAAPQRDAVVSAVRTIADAMLTLVVWVLRFAPVGVFALALVMGLRVGVGAAGALAQYVATLCAVLFVFSLALYPTASLLGRVSLRRFAAATLPAQAVAFSGRSSLAALPALVAGARDTLELPPSATGFVLPLAVSTFRVNVPIAWVVGVMFLSKLYGVPISEAQLLMLVLTATLLSFSVPGIPSASLFLLAPVLVQTGLPPEGVGILIAVDAVPDMFKTLANVTAHMTATVMTVERRDRGMGK
jgi:proton glutamate symport protein